MRIVLASLLALSLVPLEAAAATDPCRATLDAGKRSEAIDCYKKQVKKNPADADARNTLGALLVGQKKYPEALEQFDAVLAKKPTDGVALNAKAMTLLAMKKTEEAFAVLAKALDADPNNVQALGNLARINYQTGHSDVAGPLWARVLELAPDDDDAHLGLGEIALDANKLDAAAKQFDAAIAKNDKNARANWLLGKVVAQTHPKEAIVYLERASYLAPGDPNVWYDLGLTRMAAGDMQMAGQALTQAMKLAPDDARIYLELGKVHFELRDYDDAQAHFEEALALKPSPDDQAAIHFHFGLLRERQGDAQRAQEEYLKALRIRPDSTRAMTNLSVLYLSQNRTAEATTLLRKTVELEPANLPAQLNLGKVLVEAGDSDGRAHLQIVKNALPEENPLRVEAERLLASSATKKPQNPK